MSEAVSRIIRCQPAHLVAAMKMATSAELEEALKFCPAAAPRHQRIELEIRRRLGK